MKLNEWLTEEFIGKIDFLNTNENANLSTIYYLLYGLYGSYETSPVVDSISDSAIIADMINLEYSAKWKTIKKIYETEFDYTVKENGNSETVTSDIYGYNGEFTRDYKKVTEYLKNNNYSDLFTLIKNDLDTKQNINYYKIIVSDIARYLTLVIY